MCFDEDVVVDDRPLRDRPRRRAAAFDDADGRARRAPARSRAPSCASPRRGRRRDTGRRGERGAATTIACRVLPRPMSSARIARRRPSRNATPSIWCGKSPSRERGRLGRRRRGRPATAPATARRRRPARRGPCWGRPTSGELWVSLGFWSSTTLDDFTRTHQAHARRHRRPQNTG